MKPGNVWRDILCFMLAPFSILGWIPFFTGWSPVVAAVCCGILLVLFVNRATSDEKKGQPPRQSAIARADLPRGPSRPPFPLRGRLSPRVMRSLEAFMLKNKELPGAQDAALEMFREAIARKDVKAASFWLSILREMGV